MGVGKSSAWAQSCGRNHMQLDKAGSKANKSSQAKKRRGTRKKIFLQLYTSEDSMLEEEVKLLVLVTLLSLQ